MKKVIFSGIQPSGQDYNRKLSGCAEELGGR